MLYTALKVIITAVLVVAISEIGKRSSIFGAILASLPLTSLLAFLWIYGETGDAGKVAELSKSIFWYVLPSLVLFWAMPVLINGGAGFWTSLAIACGLTFIAYLATMKILSWFDIAL